MTENLYAVKFGNGDKIHAGTYMVISDDRKVLNAGGCGSRAFGTYKRVLGEISVADFLTNAAACSKCVADLQKRVAA